MKHSLYYTLIVAAFVVLVIGCSTTKSTENMLSAAGFKIIPATTAQQQARLKTLKPDKITLVDRGGRIISFSRTRRARWCTSAMMPSFRSIRRCDSNNRWRRTRLRLRK
jgi:hypothetical protein